MAASCSGGGGGGADVDGGSDGTGSLTLEWTAPSEREDNTTLARTDIQGYRIYYSKSKGSYLLENSVSVSGGSIQQFTVPANTIPSGQYFIVITTIDADGHESAYSDPALEVTM